MTCKQLDYESIADPYPDLRAAQVRLPEGWKRTSRLRYFPAASRTHSMSTRRSLDRPSVGPSPREGLCRQKDMLRGVVNESEVQQILDAAADPFGQ